MSSSSELRPLTALEVFLALAEFLASSLLLLLVAIGDLEVALEEAGVNNLDLDEVGVSERSTVSTYLDFCTDLLALEAEVGDVNSGSSEDAVGNTGPDDLVLDEAEAALAAAAAAKEAAAAAASFSPLFFKVLFLLRIFGEKKYISVFLHYILNMDYTLFCQQH